MRSGLSWRCLRGATLALAAWVLTVAAGAASFQRGVSIAHWMAKVYDPAGPGAAWFGDADLAWIAQQGFDHVRIAVDPRLFVAPDGSLEEAKLAPLDRALQRAQAHGLGVVVDSHFLAGGRFDKDAQDPAVYTDATVQAAAVDCWRRLAARWRHEGDYLRYELVNEPEAPSAAALNQLTVALVRAVRSVDAERVLYVTTNHAGVFATVPELNLPDDPHLAILLHFDEPLVFTHQRASWKQCPANMPAVEFPGRVPDLRALFPPGHFAYEASGTELNAAAIEAAFAHVDAWIRQHCPGREIYLGGFGVFEAAPAASRTRYVAAVRRAAAAHGWGWCVWAYNGGMAVRAPDGRGTPVLAGLFDAEPHRP